MPRSWSIPVVSDADLHDVERMILQAFDTRDVSRLNVLGLGELGLAVGWPADAPHAVIKRQAPGPTDQVEADRLAMIDFMDTLRAEGALVIPTDVRTIVNEDGDVIPYLVQPIVDRSDLAETIIAGAEPHPTHPILVSIRDMVAGIVRDDSRGGLSIDAQVTNFAWDGEQVVSLDTTPTLMWPPDGEPLDNVGNYLTAVPAPLRPIALRLTKRTGEGYRSIRGVLEFTSVYLLRIDQERWVDSAIECFNEVLDEPLDRREIDAQYRQVTRDLPTIKRLARIQRFWATRVRRHRYQFFITNSFTGEIY